METYLGKVGRSGRRSRPRISFNLWNKYGEVLQDLPTTNNAVKAFNGAWNMSTPPNPSQWTVLSGFKREEGITRLKVHEERQQLRHGEDEQPLEGSSRRIRAKEKAARLKNVCLEYASMADKLEYLSEIACIQKL